MDIGFYKRARGIKHKAAMPFYPRKPAPAPAAPVQAGSKAKPTAAPWPMPAPPTASVVTAEVSGSGGVAPGGAGGDADVDRRADVYISRVQEQLRRERMSDDWRTYY